MFNKEIVFDFKKHDKTKRSVVIIGEPGGFDICALSPQPCTLDMVLIGMNNSFKIEDTTYKAEKLLFFYKKKEISEKFFILDAKEQFQDFSLIDKDIDKKPNKNGFPLKDKNPSLIFSNGKRKNWN